MGPGRAAGKPGASSAARTVSSADLRERRPVESAVVRRLLAKLIATLAKLVTCPLSAFRGRDARVAARTYLADTLSVDTGRGRLSFHVGSRWDLRRSWRGPGSEPDTLEWIRAFPDGACLWDVGANVGVFSLYAALSGNVRVVAIEPAANTFSTLARNIDLNRMNDRVSAYCAAFSNKTGLDTLYMSGVESGGVWHGFGTETNQFGETISTAMRQGSIGFSIDDFVEIFSPPLPTHVKLDVDGIEPAILRGGRKVLSAPSVRSMIVEVEGNPESARVREIMALMAELGFAPRPKAAPDLRNIVFDRRPAPERQAQSLDEEAGA